MQDLHVRKGSTASPKGTAKTWRNTWTDKCAGINWDPLNYNYIYKNLQFIPLWQLRLIEAL